MGRSFITELILLMSQLSVCEFYPCLFTHDCVDSLKTTHRRTSATDRGGDTRACGGGNGDEDRGMIEHVNLKYLVLVLLVVSNKQ